MGLITGGEKGTYYQFGLDLQKLVKPAGINLTVYPSKGSIENVFAVYQRPGFSLSAPGRAGRTFAGRGGRGRVKIGPRDTRGVPSAAPAEEDMP
jgi:hypothetical protein